MTDAQLVKLLTPLANPRKVTEEQWTGIVKALLTGYGWKWSHFPPGKTVRGKWITAGAPGFPDFIAVKHKVIALELKRLDDKGRPRPFRRGQPEWLAAFQRVAAIPDSCVEAWVVHPGQVRYLVELLAEDVQEQLDVTA